MRIVVAFLMLLIPTMLDAAGEKKVKPACKRSEVAGLVLEVCVPEKSSAGAPINCIVTVTNTSKDTIAYEFTSTLREFILEIKDREGTVVPFTRYGKLLFEGDDFRFIQQKLGPGESLTLAYDLTRCFDLTIVDDYTLSAVSRYSIIKNMKISVDSLRFSVSE